MIRPRSVVTSVVLLAGTLARAQAPVVTNVQPQSAETTQLGRSVVVLGSGFTPLSRVLWNGSPRPTRFVSVRQLEASLLPGDLAKPGIARISASSVGPGVVMSNAIAFPVATSQALPAAPTGADLPAGPGREPPGAPFPELARSELEAVKLSRSIVAGKDDAMAALRGALRAAGITVIPSTGTPVAPLQPAQGIAFADWELEAMLKMSAKRMTISLADFSQGIAQAIPDLKGAPIGAMILEGIREQADSPHLTRRAWAWLLIEIGRRLPEPYDLAGEVKDEQVRLDPVQTALILGRLAADVRLLARHEPPKAAFIPRLPLLFALRPIILPLAAQSGTVNLNDPSLPGCEWEAGMNPDEAAFGMRTVFSQLMSLAGAAKLRRNTKFANVMLTYLKLILTYATLEVDMELENAPLIRTKTRQPGERRKVRADLRMTTGNLQFVNCWRLALNAVGFDFNLPPDGPVEGAKLEWKLVSGAGVVQFVNVDGLPGMFTETLTDRAGATRITVEGTAQPWNYSPSMVQVPKEFSVRANIALRPATMRGAALGSAKVLVGGPAALLNMPADMLYMTRWASSPTFTFPVIDWQECKEGWVGGITYSAMKEEDPIEERERNRYFWTRIARSRHHSYQARGQWDKNSPHTVAATANVDESWDRYHRSHERSMFDCGSGRHRTRHPDSESETGHRHEEGHLVESAARIVIFVWPNGEYNIRATPAANTLKTRGHNTIITTRVIPPCRAGTPGTSRTFAPFDSSLPAGGVNVEGRVDEKNPNLISGNLTREHPQWGTETIGWTFWRCQEAK
ncbi:MAG: hypothetical protein LC130_32350 [Bryobacterales bacterium]|nr:hypothetical protein [Bryobacterales bacterium]